VTDSPLELTRFSERKNECNGGGEDGSKEETKEVKEQREKD
jgi:hypothetical protein